jgi:methionyl-tRNA formyltransferase
MRIVVLTSSERGFASLCLPFLGEHPSIEIASVILAGGQLQRPWRHRARKLRKTLRIGPLGAINGVRMRKWYGDEPARRLQLAPLESLCASLGVPLVRVPGIAAPETVARFREAGADLGLSLGNAYIPARVFEVPRHGMINVHHEVLPEFRGAQSVIWQLHEGSRVTGYTIHQISRGIDEGAILWQERLPIEFGESLGETVSGTYTMLLRESARTLPIVVERYEELRRQAQPQPPGHSFTTPGIGQFLRIRRQHERLRAEPAATQ